MCRWERLGVVAGVALIGWALSAAGGYGVGVTGNLLLAGALVVAMCVFILRQ